MKFWKDCLVISHQTTLWHLSLSKCAISDEISSIVVKGCFAMFTVPLSSNFCLLKVKFQELICQQAIYSANGIFRFLDVFIIPCLGLV
jgi:hypothetical protein